MLIQRWIDLQHMVIDTLSLPPNCAQWKIILLILSSITVILYKRTYFLYNFLVSVLIPTFNKQWTNINLNIKAPYSGAMLLNNVSVTLNLFDFVKFSVLNNFVSNALFFCFLWDYSSEWNIQLQQHVTTSLIKIELPRRLFNLGWIVQADCACRCYLYKF